MSPKLYRLSQLLFGPAAAGEVMRRTADIPRGGKHLDVGCGPVSWLWQDRVRPIGVDVDIRRAAAFGSGVAASAVSLPFACGAFDVCWSFGLLHHLNDRDVGLAIAEFRRVTRPGGHIVIFDGVLPECRRPLASLVRALDRGHWMRRQGPLESLLGAAVRWRVERFTYAAGLEGVLCASRA